MKTFINNGNNNSYDIVHIPGTTSQYDVTAVDGKLVYTSKDGARQYTVDAAEGFRFKEDGSFRYVGNTKYKWADLFAPFLNLTGTTNIFSDGSEFATYQFNDSLLDLTNTYNASSVGTLTYEAGNYGTALNTTNGYANTGFKMSNYSAVSVSFWFKGTTTGNTYMLAENGGTSTGANASSAFHINTANGNIKIGLGNGSSTQWIEVTDAIYQDGQWRHLVVTLSGKDAKIYIDAVLKGTYTLTTTWGSYKSTSNVCIGNFGVYNNGSLNYPGLIDQMRFFDRVLSNDEVKMLNIENSVPAKASCAAWKAEGFNQSGAYNIKPADTTQKVYCDMTTDGGGWTRAFKQDFTNGNRTHIRYDLSSNLYSPLPTTAIIAEDANLDVDAEYLIVGRRNGAIAFQLKGTYLANAFNSAAHNVCTTGIDLNTGQSRTWMTIFNQAGVSGTACMGGGSSTNSFWAASDGDASHHLEYSFNTSDQYHRIGTTDNTDTAPKELEVYYRIL